MIINTKSDLNGDSEVDLKNTILLVIGTVKIGGDLFPIITF